MVGPTAARFSNEPKINTTAYFPPEPQSKGRFKTQSDRFFPKFKQ